MARKRIVIVFLGLCLALWRFSLAQSYSVIDESLESILAESERIERKEIELTERQRTKIAQRLTEPLQEERLIVYIVNTEKASVNLIPAIKIQITRLNVFGEIAVIFSKISVIKFSLGFFSENYIGKTKEKIDAFCLIVSSPGKHGPITFIVAITPEGTVKDISVAESMEVKGAKIGRRRFLRQFIGMSLD